RIDLGEAVMSSAQRVQLEIIVHLLTFAFKQTTGRTNPVDAVGSVDRAVNALVFRAEVVKSDRVFVQVDLEIAEHAAAARGDSDVADYIRVTLGSTQSLASAPQHLFAGLSHRGVMVRSK